MSKLSVNVESSKPLRSNMLFGSADILIPELYLRIREATVHESHGKRTLSDTFMNTRFGGRQRPHFLMNGGIAFGGGLPEAAAGAAPCRQHQQQPKRRLTAPQRPMSRAASRPSNRRQ